MRTAALTELVAWARERLPRLIDDVCAASCERIGMYRDEKIVPRADLRRSVAVNLGFMVDALGGGQAPDQRAPKETGRGDGRTRARRCPRCCRCTGSPARCCGTCWWAAPAKPGAPTC